MNSADKTYASIASSLQELGLDKVSQKLSAIERPTISDIALVLSEAAAEEKNDRTAELLKRAKIKQPRYFSRLLNIPERKLDIDYIEELATLAFLKDGQNLVVWGTPGTGKSWFLTAFATKACEDGMKVRTITFPNLCRTLEKAKSRSETRFESKLSYFAKFDVLCIDEFPNANSFNAFILQEFFSEMETKGVRLMVGSQSAPENWPKLMMILSFGQSMTGRIAGNCKRLQLSGPDLRYRQDLDLD